MYSFHTQNLSLEVLHLLATVALVPCFRFRLVHKVLLAFLNLHLVPIVVFHLRILEVSLSLLCLGFDCPLGLVVNWCPYPEVALLSIVRCLHRALSQHVAYPVFHASDLVPRFMIPGNVRRASLSITVSHHCFELDSLLFRHWCLIGFEHQQDILHFIAGFLSLVDVEFCWVET